MKIFKLYATMIDSGKEQNTLGVVIATDEDCARKEFENRWGRRENFNIYSVEESEALMIGALSIL